MSHVTRYRSMLRIATFALVTGIAFGVGAMAGDAFEPPVVGSFTVVDRESAFLVAAPHGDFDTYTDDVVHGVCNQVAWNCLVATGFQTEGPRINVNRPTEGVRLEDTRFSDRAASVYKAYMERIDQLNPQLRFYVEIHGNNHPESRNLIEIATAGISKARARAVRQAFDEALHARGLALRTRIDVLDDVRYRASHTREFGALSLIRPALHVELPRSARDEDRDAVISALAEALPQLAEFDEGAPLIL